MFRLGAVLRVLLYSLAMGSVLMVLSPRLAELLLFQPSRTDPGSPPSLQGVPGRLLRLTTRDGVRIQAWWYDLGEEPESSRPAVLFLHGNAGNIGDRIPIALGLLGEGLSVLLLEYRGYGGSEGKPSEEGLQLDALAGWRFLADELGESRPIIVFGRSMGGAVAARLTAEQKPAGLILESAFTSLKAIAGSVYPFLPDLLLFRLQGRFATLRWVAKIETPLLVIHGGDDDLVPPSMGRELVHGAPDPKDWLEIPGAGHNDVFRVGGADYFRRIGDFARRVGGEAASSEETSPGSSEG